MLEEENQETCGGNIILQPPEGFNELTDMYSDSTDEETPGNINHLESGLLNAPCEFQPRKPSDSEEPEAQAAPSMKRKQQTESVKWSKKASTFEINAASPPMSTANAAVTSITEELELLKLFFSDDFVHFMVDQTNLDASQKNVTLDVTFDEMWVMFGEFLLSGYAKYPNKRLYWSKENDTPILAEAMQCNRFEVILRHIHFNDNTTIDKEDWLYNLRPLLNHFYLRNFWNQGTLEDHLYIDESMIPYYGHPYAKQYIRGKPIRFGFKNWALCTSTGYMLAFNVYVKKQKNSGQTHLGVGGTVVQELVALASVPANAGYKIYFDNYFTSYHLLTTLADSGICATGTVRENQIPNCPLPAKATFSKEKRNCQPCYNKVLVIKYRDNNVVTIASNFGSPEIGQTNRYSREKKGYVSHPYPVAVKNYNSYMGGVDQLDLWEANYRSRMHQKKCWWPVFLYFFDATVVNAWLLWRKTMGNIPLLEFCRSLAVTILKSYRSASAQGMRALPV